MTDDVTVKVVMPDLVCVRLKAEWITNLQLANVMFSWSTFLKLVSVLRIKDTHSLHMLYGLGSCLRNYIVDERSNQIHANLRPSKTHNLTFSF